MITGGLWRVLRANEYKRCAFSEGIVFYDVRNKQTLYLAHPLGEVFDALITNADGLDGDGLLGLCLTSSVSDSDREIELEEALAELEKLQLVTVCA